MRNTIDDSDTVDDLEQLKAERAAKARKRWTEEDDRFLIRHGFYVGYNYVASHDLERSDTAGKSRMRWLRKHNMALVSAVERAAGIVEAREENRRTGCERWG